MDIERITREINGLYEYMRESTPRPPKLSGNKKNDRMFLLDSFTDMSGDCKEEVYVDFHLANGEVLTVRNKCLESYIAKRYVGVEMEIRGGLLLLTYTTDDKVYHHPIISLESICWIDVYEKGVDWSGNANRIFDSLGLYDVEQ